MSSATTGQQDAKDMGYIYDKLFKRPELRKAVIALINAELVKEEAEKELQNMRDLEFVSHDDMKTIMDTMVSLSASDPTKCSAAQLLILRRFFDKSRINVETSYYINIRGNAFNIPDILEEYLTHGAELVPVWFRKKYHRAFSNPNRQRFHSCEHCFSVYTPDLYCKKCTVEHQKPHQAKNADS
jgi:hypothetical protein